MTARPFRSASSTGQSPVRCWRSSRASTVMEYTPVLALQRLRLKSIGSEDTDRDYHAWSTWRTCRRSSARTIYYSPADGKNLNRVFPGKADGTLSRADRADVITREVIDARHAPRSTCTAGTATSRCARTPTGSRPAPRPSPKRGKQMALAFGLDHIVIDRERPARSRTRRVYLSNTAITRGKPALTIESGGMAVSRRRVDCPHRARGRGRAATSRHARGRPAAGGTADLDSSAARCCAPRTPVSFPSLVERGQMVAQGTLIGRITDFHGKVVEESRGAVRRRNPLRHRDAADQQGRTGRHGWRYRSDPTVTIGCLLAPITRRRQGRPASAKATAVRRSLGEGGRPSREACEAR